MQMPIYTCRPYSFYTFIDTSRTWQKSWSLVVDIYINVVCFYPAAIFAFIKMKIPDELTSPASKWLSIEETAIITTHADIPSTSSPSNFGASPAIDRHNPIILSGSRRTPATSETVISSNPSPQHEVLKSFKNSPVKDVASSLLLQKKKSVNDQKVKRKSVGKSMDFIHMSSSVLMSSSSDQNLITPPGSSRYLLSENISSDGFLDLYPVLETVRGENEKVLDLETDEKASSPFSSLNCNLALSSSDSDISHFPSNKKPEQVVVLRVSLHCKGCAAKVRKHISRMEGVTSFNIDFAAKKVTVVGDVTPLTVLATISKVKNAQLWTSDNPVLSRIPS